MRGAKRIATTLLALGVVFGAGNAWGGDPIAYLDWDDENKQMTHAVCTEYSAYNGETSLAAGMTYVVNADKDVLDFITVDGTQANPTRLILCDGATLNAQTGIVVAVGKALEIYAQSEGENAGRLVATGGEDYAGIGGGKESCGVVTINGGAVTAKGGAYAAGIGGGVTCGVGGTVTINGGDVTATGGTHGAGIGGGNSGDGGSVTINGGVVTATGGTLAAGIGGGWYKAGGEVTINGGLVTANGGSGAAGIGGGVNANGVTVAFNGGMVEATGGSNGMGIGMGNGGTDNASLTVATGYAVWAGDDSTSSAVVTDYAANRKVYMKIALAAPGSEGNPWMVGDGVTAYTNGTELVISGDGTVEDLSGVVAIDLIDMVTLIGRELPDGGPGVTNVAENALAVFGDAEFVLNLPDGWQGELPDEDGRWYGAQGATLGHMPQTIKNVRIQQRYPWDGTVDVYADVTGSNGDHSVYGLASLDGEALSPEPDSFAVIDATCSIDETEMATFHFVLSGLGDLFPAGKVSGNLQMTLRLGAMDSIVESTSPEMPIDLSAAVALPEGETTVSNVTYSATAWGAMGESSTTVGWTNLTTGATGAFGNLSNILGEGAKDAVLPQKDGAYRLSHSQGGLVSFATFTVSGYPLGSRTNPWQIGAGEDPASVTAWMDDSVLIAQPMRGEVSAAALTAVANALGSLPTAFRAVVADGSETNDVVMLLGDDGVAYADLGEALASDATSFTLYETIGPRVTLGSVLGGSTFAVSNLTAGVEIAAEASLLGISSYVLPYGARVALYAVASPGYRLVGGANPYVIDAVTFETTVDAAHLPTAKHDLVVTKDGVEAVEIQDGYFWYGADTLYIISTNLTVSGTTDVATVYVAAEDVTFRDLRINTTGEANCVMVSGDCSMSLEGEVSLHADTLDCIYAYDGDLTLGGSASVELLAEDDVVVLVENGSLVLAGDLDVSVTGAAYTAVWVDNDLTIDCGGAFEVVNETWSAIGCGGTMTLAENATNVVVRGFAPDEAGAVELYDAAALVLPENWVAYGSTELLADVSDISAFTELRQVPVHAGGWDAYTCYAGEEFARSVTFGPKAILSLPAGVAGVTFAVSNLTEGVEVAVDSSVPGGADYVLPRGACVAVYAVAAPDYELVGGANPYVIDAIAPGTTVLVGELPTAQSLAEARDDAKAAIDAALGENPSEAVQSLANAAKAAIDAAETLDDIAAARQDGLDAIAAQQQAEALAATKDEAKAAIEAAAGDPAARSEELQSTVDAAKAAIDAAGSLEEVSALRRAALAVLAGFAGNNELYPDGDGAFVAPTKATQYLGALLTAEGVVAGTVTVNVAKPNKKTGRANISAKVKTLDGTSLTFTAKKVDVAGSKDGAFVLEPKNTRAKEIGTLSIIIGGDSLTGTLANGQTVDAARNVFKDRKDPKCDRLAPFVGSWTMVLEYAGGRLPLMTSLRKNGDVRLSGSFPSGKAFGINVKGVVGDGWISATVAVNKKVDGQMVTVAFDVAFRESSGTVDIACADGFTLVAAGKPSLDKEQVKGMSVAVEGMDAPDKTHVSYSDGTGKVGGSAAWKGGEKPARAKLFGVDVGGVVYGNAVIDKVAHPFTLK